MPKRKGGRRGKAKGAPGAPTGGLVVAGGAPSPNEPERHARARVLAAEVDASDIMARRRFIEQLMTGTSEHPPLFERGATPKLLAEVWDLKVDTVQHDAAVASHIVREVAERGGTASMVLAEATQVFLGQLEDARRLNEKVTKAFADELDVSGLTPAQVRDLSAAVSNLAGVSQKALEQLGQLSGLTSKAPVVHVLVGTQSVGLPTEQAANLPRVMLEVIERVVLEHPEHRPLVGLILAELRRTLEQGPGGTAKAAGRRA